MPKDKIGHRVVTDGSRGGQEMVNDCSGKNDHKYAMESASDDETSTAKKSPTLPKKLPHQGPHAHMAVSKSKVDCARGSNNEDNRTRDGDSRGQKRLYRKLSSSSTGKCCCWSVRDVPG